MARAYQEAHVLDSLTTSVRALQAQTVELTRSKTQQEEQITNLLKANELLFKKNAELELRVKANEHNAKARTANALISLHPNPNHTTLTPLHDVGTNRPLRNFPKHERDIRTLGQAQVIACLQGLDVKTLGLGAGGAAGAGAGEKKAELRAQIGLPRTSASGSGLMASS